MDYCGSCDIAYEGRDCPVCSIKNDLQYEIDSKDKDIAKLDDKNDELAADLDSSDALIIEREKEIDLLNERIVGLQSQLDKPASGG